MISNVGLDLPICFCQPVNTGWVSNWWQEKGWDMVNPANSQKKEWVVWKSITVGGKSSRNLDIELANKGFYYHKYARLMILSQGFTTITSPETVQLVRLRVADLGFDLPPILSRINQKALDAGLQLCPPDVGPELRMEYSDQPSGECLHLGMAPIELPDEAYFNQPSQYIFYVERDAFQRGLEGTKLMGVLTSSGIHYQLDDLFIYRFRE